MRAETKTAAEGRRSQGSGEGEKLLGHSRQPVNRNPPPLTRLLPIWSDDRQHLQGWEVAR